MKASIAMYPSTMMNRVERNGPSFGVFAAPFVGVTPRAAAPKRRKNQARAPARAGARLALVEDNNADLAECVKQVLDALDRVALHAVGLILALALADLAEQELA